MVEEIQSEESDDDDSSSEEEAPIKTNPPNRDSRFVSHDFLSFNRNSFTTGAILYQIRMLLWKMLTLSVCG